MRLFYIMGLIITLISINGCAPKPGTPEATLKIKKEAIEKQQQKVEKTVSKVPKWCLKLPKSNFALYRCGFGESTNMNMSRNRAILDAKRLLADAIDSEISSRMDDFLKSTGLSSNEQIKFSTTGSAVNEFTVANAATGNAPNLSATGGDTNIDLNITPKGYGRATFNGQGKIQSVAEKVTTEATAATGTINYDVLTQAVWNFTSDSAANWTLNIRGDGSTSLDSIMDTGESITIAHIVKNGSTPYYNSAVQIDGSGVTPEWQGGAAPSAGNASSLDVYTYTVIKTGSATFTVLAAQTQFA